jgi:hypothetical protein
MFVRRTLGGVTGERHLGGRCCNGRAKNLGRVGLAATTVRAHCSSILGLSGVLLPLH